MEPYDFSKHYSLQLNYKKKGLVGLVNLGNTCFMNSILQCLSNNLKLTEYFLQDEFKKEDPENHHQKRPEYQLVLCYANLLKNIWDGSGCTVLKPRSFKTAIGKLERKYDTGTQQDSHEFLIHLLEFIHKGIAYEIEVGIKGEILKECDKMMVDCINSWSNYFGKEYSIIIDLYYGMFINQIRCLSCTGSTVGYEPFSCLSLEVVNKSKLEECLHSYFSEHDIQYKCEKCNHEGLNKRETNYWTLPNFITINLKRFNNKNAKLSNLIEFPLDNLDLTSYVSPKKEDPNHYIYTLYAVNYHTGDTTGGHYYSVIRNLDDQFYLMNDGNVSKYVSSEGIVNPNAYILFYYRKFIK